ncbi:hypothetical protein LJR084_006813 [Variovorax sp. LjRoot84]|uniref:hypothetical protein n=1 Tax=Variovorax sp. LjRoot84 TaxID=3342340 RepID=UPI003ECC724B
MLEFGSAQVHISNAGAVIAANHRAAPTTTVQPEQITDGRLVELIGDIQDELPGYGYRRA